MSVENICIRLDLAKELQRLGMPQYSYFCWFKLADTNKTVEYALLGQWQIDTDERFELIAAPISDELMAFIPSWISIVDGEPKPIHDILNQEFKLKISKNSAKNIQYAANYYGTTFTGDEILSEDPVFAPKFFTHSVYDEKLANMLAILLIRLIDLKLVKFNEK